MLLQLFPSCHTVFTAKVTQTEVACTVAETLNLRRIKPIRCMLTFGVVPNKLQQRASHFQSLRNLDTGVTGYTQIHIVINSRHICGTDIEVRQ